MNKKALGGLGIFLIILLVIILLGGGYFGYDYISKPKIISSTSDIVDKCVDSDGNDVYIKGSVVYELVEGEDSEKGTQEETCNYNHPKTDLRVGLLYEVYCDENNVVRDLTTCGRGYVCRDGACVNRDKDSPICSDTDGGKEVSKRGWITGYGGNGRDECRLGESMMDECSGEGCSVYKDYEIISCPNGCEDGRCF